MRVLGIYPGDIIRCDVRGDRFYALAKTVGSGKGATVQIESLTGRPIPTHTVRARQIVGHWRQRKGSRI